MADDLSLLLKLRGENSQLKATLADSRSAISQLRGSFGADFSAMQGVANNALTSVTTNLTNLAGHIPVVGSAIQSLGTQMASLSSNADAAAGSIATLVGPLGVTVLAAGAAVGALTLLSKQIFDITKSTAEFQGKLFDLSQQTGVSVETLSTLEVVARTTGGNIDSIVASLGIFQRNLEQSQDPTSKEAKLLEQLGVNATDTEAALRQTLAALAKMPEGFRQTSLALELFGRGGKAFLAILKESHGDIDAVTERLRAMGALVTTEVATAADKFNDQLVLLEFQARGLTALIGNEAMPVILRAVTDLSKFLSDNRGVITGWAGDIADAARGAVSAADKIKELGGSITGLGNLPIPRVLELLAQAGGAITGLSNIGRGLQSLGNEGIAPLVTPPLAVPLKPSDAPSGTVIDAVKLAKEAQVRANKEIALSLAALEEITRVHLEDLQRDRDRDLKNIDEWETEALTIAHDHRVGLEAVYDQEAADAQKFITNQEDLFLALREIEQKKTKAVNDEIKKRNEVQDAAQKDRDQAQLNLEKQLAAIRDTAREGELARIKAALDRQAITESEAISVELALLKDAQEQRLTLIDIEINQESTSAARKEELDNERIKSEQKYTDEKKRLTNERIDAANKESAATGPGSQGVAPFGGVQPGFDRGLGKPPEESLRSLVFAATEARGAFAGLGQAMAGVLGLGKETGEIFENVLTNAFGSLALAVGDAVHAFVLFGTAGEGLKKFTATLIAEIARMAAVQAVWELAQGLAMLALNFFWPDPKLAASATAHFHAAAVYGGLALVAAAAGRAVAGNSFQQQSGGGGAAGTGAGNQGRNPSDSTQQSVTAQNTDRRVFATQTLNHELVFTVKGDVVVDHFVRDYDLNGRTRIKIQSDGQG